MLTTPEYKPMYFDQLARRQVTMRSNDKPGQSFARTADRKFSLKGDWYFQTREYDHGPFDSRAQAEAELERYVCAMRYVNIANSNPAYLFGKSRPAAKRPQELRLQTSGGQSS